MGTVDRNSNYLDWRYSMNNIAIICTKDRPEDLLNLLVSIEKQSLSFNRILIIDSSKVPFPKNKESFSFEFEYHHSLPGLTLQRNFGLSKLKFEFDFCHFFDDDVELDKDYLKNFVFYAKHLKTFSLGTGRQFPNSNVHIKTKLFNIFKLSGKVLRNGMNISPDYGWEKNPLMLQWMPGCNMIFSSKIIESGYVVFDDKYRSGYCMGEDVDISLKLRDFGPIVYLPNCEYTHKLSDQNRMKMQEVYLSFLKHRVILAKMYPDIVKLNYVFISFFIENLIFKILSLVFRSKKAQEWNSAFKNFYSLKN